MSRNLMPEYVIQKVGGRFKLSALLQKRMQQLNRGAPRLVDIDTDDPMKIALAELLSGKVALMEGTPEPTPDAGPLALAGEPELEPAAVDTDADDEDEDEDESE
jgi:DNA-directed RNA polymerase subunit omega